MKIMLHLVLTQAMFWLLTVNLLGQPTFSTGIRYATGFAPRSVAVADLNGDFKPDVVTANYYGGFLTVLTNQGNGDLILCTNISVANPQAVVISDVNRDGKMDLICANVGSDTVTIFTNGGKANFLIASAAAVGHHPWDLLAADVNNDHKVDLVTANYSGGLGGNTLSVLTNDGAGNFTLASNPAGWPYSVASADVNEDGKMDLITAGGGYLMVLTNVGVTLTNFPGSPFAVCSSPHIQGVQKVATADVNGDGHVDLITANTPYDTVSILTNDGKGNFVVASSSSVLGGPACLAVADMNGDGYPDLVVGTVYGSIYTDNGLTVLTNDGAGNFTIVSKFNAAGPSGIAVADLNGDGKADLVAAEEALNRAGVFFQVPQLSLADQTSSILISWPATWTNWVLQANPDLRMNNWAPVDNVLNDGTNKSATAPVSNGNLFFRLQPLN